MKTIGRLLLLLVVVAAVFALTMYRAPLWTETQLTHFGLFLSRVQSNYVMTPEGRAHYYEAEPRIPGGGVPLVLVHGLGDRAESWAPMLKRLKRAGFHVYALDLLGYGRSPKPGDSDFGIGTEEKFVVDFIHALGLQQTNIGGWSMGGWVTMKVAIDHPELIDRVVLYDSAGVPGVKLNVPANFFHPQGPRDIKALYAAMEPEAKPLPDFVARDAVRKFAAGQDVLDKSLSAMRSGKDSLEGELGKLKQPVLIVWGAVDNLTPVATGRTLHAAIPQSELDVVEGCGHLAPKTCSLRVAGATADFLKTNPAPAGGERMLVRGR